MSSAFRNFFITFIICLAIFGFVGFKVVYPLLEDAVDGVFEDVAPEQSGTASEDVSGDTENSSDESQDPGDDYDEDGDIFTAAVLLCGDDGKPVACSFLDSNGKSRRFLMCSVSPSVKVMNEVGVSVPLSDMLPQCNDKGVCDAFTALTGLPTDYCVRVSRESLITLVSLLPEAEITLPESISFVNPAYENLKFGQDDETSDGFVFDDDPSTPATYPDDYFITLTDVYGKVDLKEIVSGKTKLQWLLEYNPNADKSEYNDLYLTAARALYKQFFNSAESLKSTSVITLFLANTQTNITPEDITEHLDTIFSYNDFKNYELSYPGSWEQSVERLREADGRTY